MGIEGVSENEEPDLFDLVRRVVEDRTGLSDALAEVSRSRYPLEDARFLFMASAARSLERLAATMKDVQEYGE